MKILMALSLLCLPFSSFVYSNDISNTPIADLAESVMNLEIDSVDSIDSIEEEDVPINEDLMREHGILNRCLLIYEEIAGRIGREETFPLAALTDTATIIRNYLENHHEKMEEEFIFPRLEQANILVEVTTVLREQHIVGRQLTDFIMSVNAGSLDSEKTRLFLCLHYYVRMFRPHEAREGTVVFPAFKNLVSEEEYKEIGEECERIEHELFGDDAFEQMVNSVELIEKQLGIFELSQFTPAYP